MIFFAHTHALPSGKCQHLHTWETCSALLIKVLYCLLESDSTGLDGQLDRKL